MGIFHRNVPQGYGVRSCTCPRWRHRSCGRCRMGNCRADPRSRQPGPRNVASCRKPFQAAFCSCCKARSSGVHQAVQYMLFVRNNRQLLWKRKRYKLRKRNAIIYLKKFIVTQYPWYTRAGSDRVNAGLIQRGKREWFRLIRITEWGLKA